jgi:dihydroflavonol-4-reductase
MRLFNKILVTGGTGFLGAYIIRDLIKKGYQVRAIRRHSPIPSFIPKEILERAEWIDGNVLDIVALEEAMEGMDAVIHSAAIVSFIKKDRKKMMHVNVDGTANVINAGLEKNIKKIIHISSVAALGRLEDGGNVNEEKKWQESRVNTDYAISKHKSEMEIWRGISEGLPAIILNPSTILGYGNWNSSSCAIFRNIYNEFPWYAPGLNGFVDVEDVAEIATRFLEHDLSSERFIVNADNWTFKKLQDTIADSFGKKRPGRKTTAFMLGVAWRLEKLKAAFTRERPLLTKQSAKVALSETRFENDKILRVLPGFSFTPLENSIQKACEKYLRGLG